MDRLGYLSVFLFLLCVLLTKATAQEDEKPLLVVIEEKDEVELFTQVVSVLKDGGYEVVVKMASEAKLSLKSGSEYLYDGLIVLAPKVSGIGVDVTVDNIMEFVDNGGNLFVAAAPVYSSFIEKLVAEIGVQLDEKRHMVIDHANYLAAMDDGTHTTIVAGGHSVNKPLTNDVLLDGIVFRGIGAGLIEDNDLVEKVLWGSKYSYSANYKENLAHTPLFSGEETILASVIQTRSSSRAVYVGSLDMFTDSFLDQAGKNHRTFVSSLLPWIFGARGHLRYDNFHFHRVGEVQELSTYRVKDNLVVYIDLLEWHRREKQWKPLMESDVQIEFTSLDPYVRTRLIPVGNGTFTANVPVSDHIGIYKFTVEYFRPGYTPIIASRKVSIRPFLHDEYERFIFRATPYYITAILNLVGVFIFGLVFLYGKQNDKTGTDTSKKDN